MEPRLGQPLVSDWDRTRRTAYALAHRFFAPNLDVDDLAQEALVGAVQARRVWDGRGEFHGFEATLMRRRVIDAVDRARKPHRYQGPAEELTEEVPDRADTAVAAVHRLELRRVLDSLPSLTRLEQRAVVGGAIGFLAHELDGTKATDNAGQRGLRKLRAA